MAKRVTGLVSSASLSLLCPLSSQGKSFIKDALKCKAHALRHRFGCISRKCPAIKEMVFQLQRECYLKHDRSLSLGTKEDRQNRSNVFTY